MSGVSLVAAYSPAQPSVHHHCQLLCSHFQFLPQGGAQDLYSSFQSNSAVLGTPFLLCLCSLTGSSITKEEERQREHPELLKALAVGKQGKRGQVLNTSFWLSLCRCTGGTAPQTAPPESLNSNSFQCMSSPRVGRLPAHVVFFSNSVGHPTAKTNCINLEGSHCLC
ncbi:hypothetical protein F0562_011849 [Nyssa sinensis]|uniref:Uncharacterized protein n=1 Tax=Nyssa sinensis TaxID=561372 RepID=A0A5J4ZTK6_9ASTE|nr:hypothetical protein F0562_011849 [Nyssa sinensis]